MRIGANIMSMYKKYDGKSFKIIQHENSFLLNFFLHKSINLNFSELEGLILVLLKFKIGFENKNNSA